LISRSGASYGGWQAVVVGKLVAVGDLYTISELCGS
jgi:hypothetical protein